MPNVKSKTMDTIKAAVVVPTLNAGVAWPDWIRALLATGINKHDVYVVDSGSADDTVLLAVEAGFNINRIQPGTFNHGGTRKKAIADLIDYNIVIFLTQDAILKDKQSLAFILQPFEEDAVSTVCGRQLPRKKATHVEAHARLYNYPANSFKRSIEDAQHYGLKTAFISNSYSAYRITALNEIGGFPENVIFGEDMYVAAKLLQAGYTIAYAADASVYHSHNYTVWQEFRRYFDMGVFHASEPWIRQEFGGAEGEGMKFVSSEIGYLLKYEASRIPEVFFRVLLRYSGFRLGLLEKRLPLSLKRFFAMNKGYFKK